MLYPLSYKAIFYYFSCPDGTRTRNFPNQNRSIPYLRHCSVFLYRKQKAEKESEPLHVGICTPEALLLLALLPTPIIVRSIFFLRHFYTLILFSKNKFVAHRGIEPRFSARKTDVLNRYTSGR